MPGIIELGNMEESEGGIIKEHEETFEGNGYVYNLDYVGISLYKQDKNDLIINFKYVQFIVCKLQEILICTVPICAKLN